MSIKRDDMTIYYTFSLKNNVQQSVILLVAKLWMLNRLDMSILGGNRKTSVNKLKAIDDNQLTSLSNKLQAVAPSYIFQ